MDTLRYGFVGAGTIARVHAERLAQRSDAVLAAVADPSEATLAETADRFNIPGRYADYRAMLEKESLDVVVVCVPNAYHAEATLAALKADCHVLCEKPPALNAQQAEEMAAAAAQRNLRLIRPQHALPERNRDGAQLPEGRPIGRGTHATVQMWRRRGIPGLGSWFTTKAVPAAVP